MRNAQVTTAPRMPPVRTTGPAPGGPTAGASSAQGDVRRSVKRRAVARRPVPAPRRTPRGQPVPRGPDGRTRRRRPGCAGAWGLVRPGSPAVPGVRRRRPPRSRRTDRRRRCRRGHRCLRGGRRPSGRLLAGGRVPQLQRGRDDPSGPGGGEVLQVRGFAGGGHEFVPRPCCRDGLCPSEARRAPCDQPAPAHGSPRYGSPKW